MKILKMILVCLLALAGFALAITVSCAKEDQPVSTTSQDQQLDREKTTSVLTFDDVFGEHNPKMIGGWAGELTQETWFLRQQRVYDRLSQFKTGLLLYFGANGHFPETWDDYDKSGFFPIRPLDPIDGSEINFGQMPQGTEDFRNVEIVPGSNKWVVSAQTPEYPSGEWSSVSWEFNNPDGTWEGDIVQQNAEDYPNEVAMRGFLLAMVLESVLFDFEHRRHAMPESSSDLLDGLWTIGNKYANPDDTLDVDVPTGFMFGIDKTSQVSFARWYDLTGQVYELAWKWDPWPSGWHEVPAPGEPGSRREGMHGMPWDPPCANFMPETVIWKCELN